MTQYFAAIEAGGTKFNCAILDSDGRFVARDCFATETPEITLAKVIEFFTRQQTKGLKVESLGIASFGPLDLHSESPTYGAITHTPKPGWSNTPLVSTLCQALGAETLIDTDVNGAALAEATLGAGRGNSIVVYITVGTGVGGGIVVNGQPLHGLVHPEIGHMLVPGDPQLTGQCPFHSQCVEGFASGKAMSQIWGQSAETLDFEHPAWQLEATVLSQLCHNVMLSFSPQTIVLGGGVMGAKGLLEKVIEKTNHSLNQYLVLPEGISLSDIIVAPGLGDDSGIYGAFLLAKQCTSNQV